MADYPVMPWFPRDWIADTRKLSLAERGAYNDLLNFSWLARDGSLPDDDQELAQMLGVSRYVWLKIRPAVAKFFTISDGRWYQKRLRVELESIRRRHLLARDSGRLGGIAKARNRKGLPLAIATNSLADSPSENVAISKHLTKKKEEEPPSHTAAGGQYAFAGVVIKLTKPDLARWAGSFASIDLKAKLTALDAWIVDNPSKHRRWFACIASILAKEHETNLAKGWKPKRATDRGNTIDELMHLGEDYKP